MSDLYITPSLNLRSFLNKSDSKLSIQCLLYRWMAVFLCMWILYGPFEVMQETATYPFLLNWVTSLQEIMFLERYSGLWISTSVMSLLKCSASKFKVSVTYEEYPCTKYHMWTFYYVNLWIWRAVCTIEFKLTFLFPIINHDEAKWVERARNWSVSSSKPPSLIPLSKKPPPNFAYYWLVPGTKAKIISFTIAVMKLL